MAELLVEILCEEIPARMQSQACLDFRDLFLKALDPYALSVENLKTFMTPRRMTLVANLATATEERNEERRGPKVSAPDNAVQGFLRSAGVTLDQCTQQEGYWYAKRQVKAQQTVNILQPILEEILRTFPWPKSMRWPKASIPWVRPIRNILCIFDEKPLALTFEILGLVSNGQTFGHRFLSPQAFSVTSFKDYQAQLEKAFVILDRENRKIQIRSQIEKLAQSQGLSWIEDNALLEEVSGLVEFPVVVLGRINPEFMALPAPVLMTSMRVHQRYFAFNTMNGALAPFFAAVSNTTTTDQNAEMINGFERVLAARLSDAQFFWEQDLRQPLESQASKLKDIIFHAKLGTLAQKTARLQQLVASPAAKRAASLCKSDLLTQMVGEFPELQGQMGEIYARAQGENANVAAAIRAHYQPQGPNDICPQEPASIELALADKIDTLIGFFAINELPSGSRDPYALRRAALGVIRLIRENDLKEFDLRKTLQEALLGYQTQEVTLVHSDPVSAAYDFILERLAVALKAEGVRYDAVQAVITPAQRQGKTLWSMAVRAIALHHFLETPDGQALFMAARRTLRILEDMPDIEGTIDTGLLHQEEERQFFDCLQNLKIQSLLAMHAYEDTMKALSTCRPVVDAFFDKVTVNTEDPGLRQNRLLLLTSLTSLLASIADFRQLEG